MRPTLIIAEAGVNHNGSLDMALQLIDAATEVGADIVKFQTFKAEAIISRFAPKAEYQKTTTDMDESQLEMVKKLELSPKMHQRLLNSCKERNIEFLSTPFDIESARFLVQKIGMRRIKIPSGEITNAPFLLELARLGKPVILSTGMSTLDEVELALGVLAFGYLGLSETPSERAFRDAIGSDAGRAAIACKVSLLQCTSEYPAPFDEVNLRAMNTLSTAFGLPVGLSDHTPGITIPIAAVALGASIIEKHFTMDHNLPGPDHRASLEPRELRQMVSSIREVEAALGSPEKIPARSELKNLRIVRKSLVALRDIVQGEPFNPGNLGCKRPGTGASPFRYWQMLGRKADRNYHEDEMIEA